MGKQYSWDDYSIAYGSRILEGVVGVKYTPKQEKELLFGRGSNAHNIVRGNKSNSGSVKLWQSEVERMIADAPDKDIFKLRFNITEAFTPKDGGQTVINILEGVEITELPRDFNQGDKNQVIELPFIFLKWKPHQ